LHITIKPGIYWVGAVDWGVRDFHGYHTQYGTSYNAYVVRGEKVALVDTVKYGFQDQLFERLDHAGIEKIDYLIVNHVEMDHAGSVKAVMERFPEVKIVTNARGKIGLKEAYGIDEDAIIVKTGDRLDLGGKTLTFIETPMVHWPDSMATYVIEDRVLLPNDAFGMHYASSKRFDDEFSQEEMGRIFFEAAKYYANIVLLYSNQVQRVLRQIEELGLELDVIAPSHGIIWRSNIQEILQRYRAWSAGEADERVIIVYDSMWLHTEEAAFEVAEGVADEGVEFRLYRLKNSDWTEVMTEIMISRGVIVGSPTLNRELFPTVAGFLAYMKGLKPFNKVAGAFGSYGWSGEAVGKIVDIFNQLRFDVVGSVRWKYSANEKTIEELRELGRSVAKKVRGS